MAARSLGTLTLDLVMRLGGFKQGADASQREFDKMARGLKSRANSLAGDFKTLGASLLGGLSIAAVIAATAEAEKAFAKLDNAVKSNGGAAGRTTQQLADLSGQLQSVTTYTDDSIQVAESLLLRFKSIQGVNFDRTVASVLDIATAMEMDLSGAAKLVGRALEDPEKGMARLAKAGILFSAAQKDVIANLMETGQVAAAQTFMLDALDATFGNAAESARNNFGGALIGLKNAFGDLLEAKGGLPEATRKLEEFSKLLADPKTKQAADVFLTTVITALGNVAAALAPVIELFAKGINAAGDFGARIDHALGRKFDDATEERLFSINAQLEELQARRDALEASSKRNFLVDKGRIAEEIAAIDAEAEALRKLQGGRTSKGTPPGGRNRAGPGNGLQVVTSDDLTARDKILADITTAQEKYNDAMEDADRLLVKHIITQKEYDRYQATAAAELNKALAGKSGGKSDAARETEQATKKVQDFIAQLNQQRETLGMTQAELLRYSVATGDVAKALDAMGAAAAPFRTALPAIVDANITATATQAIEDQIKALQEQAITIGMTEQQAFAYSVTQGELAKVLRETGLSQEELTRRLLEGYQATVDAQKAADAERERASIYDATRTAAEAYALELEHLQELFANSSDQETYGRAVADSVEDYITAGNAVTEYRLRLEELARLLASGDLSPEAYKAAVEGVDRTFAEAGKKSAQAFSDEAKRNVQGIVADFLVDPFSEGIDGLGRKFGEMLLQMAAQAIAAQIADAIFSGFDDWINKAKEALASLASGSGGGALGWLGGLLGGGGGGDLAPIEITAQYIPGYAAGGYTGDGPALQPAGVVHRGEFVTSAAKVRQPGVLNLLQRIQYGPMDTLRALESRLPRFAVGGLVGAAMPGAVRGLAAATPGGSAGIPSVVQNFSIAAPAGTVSRSTQQQVAAAAARGLSQASRRNN